MLFPLLLTVCHDYISSKSYFTFNSHLCKTGRGSRSGCTQKRCVLSSSVHDGCFTDTASTLQYLQCEGLYRNSIPITEYFFIHKEPVIYRVRQSHVPQLIMILTYTYNPMILYFIPVWVEIKMIFQHIVPLSAVAKHFYPMYGKDNVLNVYFE